MSPKKRPGAAWRTSYPDAQPPAKRLVKPPTESWWLVPMTREQFEARAKQLDPRSHNAIQRSPGGFRD